MRAGQRSSDDSDFREFEPAEARQADQGTCRGDGRVFDGSTARRGCNWELMNWSKRRGFLGSIPGCVNQADRRHPFVVPPLELILGFSVKRESFPATSAFLSANPELPRSLECEPSGAISPISNPNNPELPGASAFRLCPIAGRR